MSSRESAPHLVEAFGAGADVGQEGSGRAERGEDVTHGDSFEDESDQALHAPFHRRRPVRIEARAA
jgi:hypothetical protein